MSVAISPHASCWGQDLPSQIRELLVDPLERHVLWFGVGRRGKSWDKDEEVWKRDVGSGGIEQPGKTMRVSQDV